MSALRRQGRQTRGGPAALHVNEDAWGFRHDGQTDVLHHQRKARAGGDGEGFGSAPHRALNVIEAASSSSIWMKVPPTVGTRAAKRSTTSVEGVMG